MITFLLTITSALTIGLTPLPESAQKGNSDKVIETPQDIANKKLVKGLKQALEKGAKKAVEELNQKNGYFKDELVKIPFPPKAKKMEDKLRSNGFNSLVDKLIKKINRAAEDASEKAQPIFIDAIKNMSVQDAASILKGSDSAATHYFRENTYQQLFKAFKPDIQKSLEKVGAQGLWKKVSKTYNSISLMSDPIETDLAAYTTRKALDGLFLKIKKEEKKIRKDPVARTTEVLKDVFGKLGGG